MKWYLHKIPKTLHVCWDRGEPLSYMRVLTVLTFSKLNPDWSIVVHTIEEGCRVKSTLEDCFTELEPVPNITFQMWKAVDVYSVKWNALAQGGVWSDFDILYVRPMWQLPFNDEYHKDIDVVTYYCRNHKTEWNTMRFLMGGKETNYSFYRELANRTKPEMIRFEKITVMDNYFRFSPELAEMFWQQMRIRIHNMPMACVYPTYKPELYYRVRDFFLDDATIGLFWLSGSAISDHYESRITKDNMRKFKRVFLFRKALEVLNDKSIMNQGGDKSG